MALVLVTGLHFALWQWFKQNILEFFTSLLAIAAIVFATLQFVDSRKQEKYMRDLAEQMSTRFIGAFPDNLEPISEIVSHSHKTLDIMVDTLGYGEYSAPAAISTTYLRALEDAR